MRWVSRCSAQWAQLLVLGGEVVAVPAWFGLCLQIYVKDFQACFWSGKIAFPVSDGAGLGGAGPASRQAGGVADGLSLPAPWHLDTGCLLALGLPCLIAGPWRGFTQGIQGRGGCWVLATASSPLLIQRALR